MLSVNYMTAVITDTTYIHSIHVIQTRIIRVYYNTSTVFFPQRVKLLTSIETQARIFIGKGTENLSATSPSKIGNITPVSDKHKRHIFSRSGAFIFN